MILYNISRIILSHFFEEILYSYYSIFLYISMSQTIHCPSCNTEIDLDRIADEKFSAKLHEQEKLLKQEAVKQRENFEKEMERNSEEVILLEYDFINDTIANK